MLPNGKIIYYQNKLKYYDTNTNKLRYILSDENYNNIMDLLNKKGIVGSYTGTAEYADTLRQNINIGFKPTYVFVCGIDTNNHNDILYGSSINNINTGALGFTDTGFYVGGYNNSGHTRVLLNDNSYTYTYLCF